MQESAKNVKILNALLTDYSPLFCSFLNLSNISRVRAYLKFNNSLISNTNFAHEMKILIQNVIFRVENNIYFNGSGEVRVTKIINSQVCN